MAKYTKLIQAIQDKLDQLKKTREKNLELYFNEGLDKINTGKHNKRDGFGNYAHDASNEFKEIFLQSVMIESLQCLSNLLVNDAFVAYLANIKPQMIADNADVTLQDISNLIPEVSKHVKAQLEQDRKRGREYEPYIMPLAIVSTVLLVGVVGLLLVASIWALLAVAAMLSVSCSAALFYGLMSEHLLKQSDELLEQLQPLLSLEAEQYPSTALVGIRKCVEEDVAPGLKNQSQRKLAHQYKMFAPDEVNNPYWTHLKDTTEQLRKKYFELPANASTH